MNILTIGTFDVPHMGHYSFISKIRDLFPNEDQFIIIAVNSDEFVERFKGARTIFNQSERRKLMSSIKRTHVVANSGDEDVSSLILTTKANVIAIGSDWHKKDYLKQLGIDQDFLDRSGVSVIYIPYTDTISTTEIKRRISPPINTNVPHIKT